MLRIFIKKWIFIFLIIIFDLFIGLRTARQFFFFFFWFLISWIAVCWAWLGIEYFFVKLSLNRKIVGKIEEDDFLEVEATLENKSFLPLFNVVLQDYLSCATPQERQKRVSLEFIKPRSFLNIKYNCWCPLRGKYKLGPFFIYIFDPWGLFFLKKQYFIYSEIYVYPQTFHIHKLPELTKGTAPWFGIETSRASGDEHEFYGIREYKYGDPIKRIHWLSTARKNKLIVKQFQHQVFYRVIILFNLDKTKNFGQGKESVTEYTIKIAASVAKYFIERDVSLAVIAHAQEIVQIPFNKGSEHLEDIMRFLAVAQPESRVSLGEVFEEFANYIPNDSSLVVIMPDVDWEYMLAMLSLQKRNVSMIPLILLSSSFLAGVDNQKAMRDIRMSLPQEFGSAPLFFSRGESLEEPFLK
ncbi:MAG: DUF58 domain-containing protein [Candidatus Omnitrophica bacterium]|nr:DUF58 domain-containing protein [Candidatus Omnitrophota bacterium]